MSLKIKTLSQPTSSSMSFFSNGMQNHLRIPSSCSRSIAPSVKAMLTMDSMEMPLEISTCELINLA